VDHFHRPEGCILSHPNPLRIPEASTLPGAGKGIQVSSFTLRAKYEVSNSDKGIGDKLWHSSPPVYRPLAEQDLYKGGGSTNYAFPSSTHSAVRLDCQSAKVRTHTLSVVRVPVLQI
jgi:hypothetical protein